MTELAEIVGEIPFQLGYLLPEIGDAESYVHALGVSAFERFDDAPVYEQTYHGVPVALRQNLVLGFRQGLNIKMIEVIEGRSAYSDVLDTKPVGGLFHVEWKVDDLEQATAAMLTAGHEPVQTGRFGERGGFLYFDTRRKHGFESVGGIQLLSIEA